LNTYRALGPVDPTRIEERIIAAFRESLGGKNLIDVGMESDLATCAAIDSLSVVPRLDPIGNRLVASPLA
jgi:phosphosulfolactate phosphohydrolase-like enzyme